MSILLSGNRVVKVLYHNYSPSHYSPVRQKLKLSFKKLFFIIRKKNILYESYIDEN